MRCEKRGQTLVEVLVAVTMLALVFASSVTLIIEALNLAMVSRNSTVAVELAQKGISEARTKIMQSCLVAPLAENSNVITYPLINNMQLTVTAKTPTSSEVGTVSGFASNPVINPSNYYKIISTVTWQDKGSPSQTTYSTSSIIAKAH